MNFLTSFRCYKLILPTLKKCLHTSPRHYGADKQLLSKLRKSTGFSFVNCRKALEKFDNDIKQAEKWLKEEAQKEGWAKASKLQGRPMSQGLIGLSIKDNLASIVEVNCETDFVARNLKFQSFVASVVDTVHQHGKSNTDYKILMTHDQLNKLQINDKSILDLTALEVGNLGENILVRRGVLMRPDKSKRQFLSFYIHTTGPKLQQTSGHCLLGKYAALVVCQENDTTTPATTTATPPTATTASTSSSGQEDSSSESDGAVVLEKKILTREELGRQLCQHIVGMNPKCIGYDTHISMDGTINNSLTGDTNENIAQTDVNKKEGDDESKSKKVTDADDECRLVQQEYMLDTNYKVIDVLNDNNVTIIDFVRVECGEDIEKEEKEVLEDGKIVRKESV